MNGIRPWELLEVIAAAVEAACAEAPWPVLATVVSLDGSVYARAGASALVLPRGASGAGIPAGELSGALAEAVREVSLDGKPLLCAVALAEDDPAVGLGLGSPGQVEILLEPVDGPLLGRLQALREAILKGGGVVSAVEIAGPELGKRTLYPPEHAWVKECYRESSPELLEAITRGGVRRTFLCPLRPMGKVLLFGSGGVAQTLSAHLAGLGFSVFVADPRPGRLRGAGFDRARMALIEGGWEQARAAAGIDEETSIVVMTRSYALDLETLQGALKSPASYVGLLATLKQAQRMLHELEILEVKPRPGVLCAPAGLNIGAEGFREQALAIAAEILAARSGRLAGRPLLVRPQRAEGEVKARAKVPGLVLAAGRGKRFAGGHKLSMKVAGKPVLRWAVEAALASKLDPVIVVLGCEAGEALQTLEGLEDAKLRVVFNPHWKGGKASSIECGLREAPWNAPGVVALLGDMPKVPAWLVDRVLAEFELSGKLCFPVYPGPKGLAKGYPTAFPRSLFSEIRSLTGDETAMEAVRAHWAEAVKIPLPDAATQADVDTVEDLQLLLKDG